MRREAFAVLLVLLSVVTLAVVIVSVPSAADPPDCVTNPHPARCRTPTPTPTPTTTAPTPTPTTTAPGGFHAPGQDMGASNTGFLGDPATLIPAATTVYDSTYDGQTITGRAYTHRVDITGTGITIDGCTMTNGGLNSVGFAVFGDGVTIQNCTITSPPGQSMYEPVWLLPGDDGATIRRNNISRGENLMTTYGTNALITENYLHDVALDSNPGDHPDGIEIYGGGPVTISNNRIIEGNLYDSPINAAPYSSYTLTDMTVAGNMLDNGQAMTLIDNQSTAQPGAAGIRNTRILANAMGGHTNPSTVTSFGIYKALENYEGRPTLQTEAQLQANPLGILWPTTGADANYWEETAPLSPNRDGLIVLPTCPDPC